jgi:hypothetical protein
MATTTVAAMAPGKRGVHRVGAKRPPRGEILGESLESAEGEDLGVREDEGRSHVRGLRRGWSGRPRPRVLPCDRRRGPRRWTWLDGRAAVRIVSPLGEADRTRPRQPDANGGRRRGRRARVVLPEPCSQGGLRGRSHRGLRVVPKRVVLLRHAMCSIPQATVRRARDSPRRCPREPEGIRVLNRGEDCARAQRGPMTVRASNASARSPSPARRRSSRFRVSKASSCLARSGPSGVRRHRRERRSCLGRARRVGTDAPWDEIMGRA